MRSPGWTSKARARSVFKSSTRTSPRYPESIRPRRVHERDPVLRGEAGARQHQARVARRDLDRDSGADAGALARAERRRLGGVQVEAGIALVGAAGQPGTVPKQADAELHAAWSVERPLDVCRRDRAGTEPVSRKVREPVRQGRRDAGPDEDALGAVLALEVAGQLVQLGEARALRVGDQQLDRPQRLLETASSIRSRSSSSPSSGRRPRSPRRRARGSSARARRRAPAGRPC